MTCAEIQNQSFFKLWADKLLHILWIVRQLFQAFVIGYTIVASGLIMSQLRYQKEHQYLEYNAFKAFFQAAFLEVNK